MLAPDPQLAPLPVLVRYLAAFHRFFDAVVNYTHRTDKPGMLLGGVIANELHNIPIMLWHCDPNAWHNPADMEVWMDEFPESLYERGAPDRLVEDSRRILSAKGAAQELGLRDDLADLDLAPVPRIRNYLDCLYDTCLSMRFMQNYGGDPPDVWKGLDQAWSVQAERADAQAAYNGVIADLLVPLPYAMVHWQTFNEEQFYKDILNASERVPHQSRQAWVNYFRIKANTLLG